MFGDNVKNDKNYIRKRKLKKIKKRRYTIGKNLKKRTIGIMIKNKTLKKKIIDKKQKLQKTSIYDVKKYLRKRGLIKVGSAAPKDILKSLYIDSNLSGNIFNKSPEILLHNYLNE